MNIVEITFSHYFSKEDVDEFNNLVVIKYKFESKQLEPLPEKSGGLIWEGIVIFISGSIAAGFLGAIGQDTYNWLKEKFFEKKIKLEKSNIEKFTINIKISNSMVFFNLTNLNKGDFVTALNKAQRALLENTRVIKRETGSYNFIFNTKTKRWELKRDKSFDT